MIKTGNFKDAIAKIQKGFTAKTMTSPRWQGVSVNVEMHEQLNVSFQTIIATEDLDYHRRDIQPNLPWADNHFLERVGGQPLNPGVEWANWPYAKSADKFRESSGIFNHNYMQRYWPRYAGLTPEGKLSPESAQSLKPHKGIYGEYGDLNSLISLMQEDPYTRQAFLPIFFPEDTGNTNPGRKPCTIGYHFLMRNDYLHCTYYIRSCDFIRHFRDDIYLTVRLQLWVLDQLRQRDSFWESVYPGDFIMHIANLHVFHSDYVMKVKHGENI